MMRVEYIIVVSKDHKLNAFKFRNNDIIILVALALHHYPPNCLCLRETSLLCYGMNLTRIPHVLGDVSMMYLERNRIQLTDDSLNGLNLTHKL